MTADFFKDTNTCKLPLFSVVKLCREKSYWSLLEHPPKGMEIDIVRAENSDRWDQDTVQRLENLASRKQDDSEGKVAVHVLPKAGHWVHVDNPRGLVQILAPKIDAFDPCMG